MHRAIMMESPYEELRNQFAVVDLMQNAVSSSKTADFTALASDIKRWGSELGFQQVGIAGCELGEAETRLLDWLSKGYHGEMEYMQRHGTKRARPADLVPGTLRVIAARLNYLPPAAQDRLLDTITELSAPGSRIALESVPNVNPEDHEKAIERMRDASERWRDHGFDLDFAELVYLGDRNEAAAYLGDHGWELTRNSVKELFAANGLPWIDEKEEGAGNFGELQYVSGVLNGARR